MGRCTIDAVMQYIKDEHHIASPFKLRVWMHGKLRYLKPSQRLEDVAAMGADVILMNYRDRHCERSASRKLAKEPAAFAWEAAPGDGFGRKRPARDEAPALRASVRRLVDQASAEALGACEEVLQAYHDHGGAEPKRRRLEGRGVRIDGKRPIADPTTAPYLSAVKAEELAFADGLLYTSAFAV